MVFLSLSLLLSMLSILEYIFPKGFFAANVLNNTSGVTSFAALACALISAIQAPWSIFANKKMETKIPRLRALSYLCFGLMAAIYSLFFTFFISLKDRVQVTNKSI